MKKSQFQFSTPELTCVDFKINSDFNHETDMLSDIVTKTEISRNAQSPEAYVLLTVTSPKENNLPFYFEVTMGVNVFWNNECDESFVDAILKSNVPALILSYIRPIISILTSNSGYPTYNIPFLDFRNLDKEKK